MILYNRHASILLFLLLVSCSIASGQRSLILKTGTFPLRTDTLSRGHAKPQYLFYEAGHIISESDRADLLKKGVEVLYALRDNVYWVRITNTIDQNISRRLFTADVHYKLGITIEERSAISQLRVSVAPGIKEEEVIAWSIDNNIKLDDIRALAFGFVDVTIAENGISVLLNTPWVSFIEERPVDVAHNYRLLNAERGWSLISPLFRGLDGSGMTIGIGDEGRLGPHQDLLSSVQDLASFGISNHSMQVAGIVTGSGLLDPSFGFGYAPQANVLVRNFSDILWDTPQYIDDYNLSLTNNSYGTHPYECDYIGDYNGTSAALDAMMSSFPNLLHVFSAGNSGTITCSPYPLRYATIAGGYQSSKNVLTVGALRAIDLLPNFSSRGPVDDGRLKPEVVAYGQGRFSTISNNNFGSNSGTSFSSPATMGMATLLYQRYKELHNDSLPDATLIKNIICNSADDLGLNGPDFSNGFGRINGDRSVQIIEQEQHASVSISHNTTAIKTFVAPPNVSSIDVMLMWADVPAAPYETVSLVNDLDIIVIDPTGDTIRPWKLNYTPAGVLVAATTGADHTNNCEQVTVPVAEQGTYTIIVKGYNVPMGSQKAWLSWDLHYAGVVLQSPNGGEVFKPGNPSVPVEEQYIRWDAFGTGNSTFTAEYSTNGGASWNLIAANIPSTLRYQGWYVPNVFTDQLRVKISASNGMADTSQFNSVIMAPPSAFTLTSPCNGYIQANWNSVAGADYYKLYLLQNETLILLDTTSGLSMVLEGFSEDTTYWIAVSGVFPSGADGLRTRAVSITPNGGNNCGWNNDLRLNALVIPTSGRAFTSTELSSTETIGITLTNAGLIDASGITLSYQINEGSIITESFLGALIAGTTQSFSFSQTADLSPAGVYEIKVWTNYTADQFHENDTVSTVIKHLTNAAITLPWNEDFDLLPDEIINKSTLGFANFSSLDAALQENTRIRTFAGSPFCHSGSRSLTMDAERNVASETGEIILTLNLENYSVIANDLRLSLHYMHHEILPDIVNTESIWVRGSDADTFVLLTMLTNEANTRGIWQNISGLELSDTLISAGQDFSSSFQIKFPFNVYATAGDPLSQDGQTIDDLSIEEITRDLEMTAVVSPSQNACGLGVEAIEVMVTNTANKPVASTSLSYSINNGTVHTTSIGSVPKDTSIQYALLPAYDFSLPGEYHLKVWLSTPNDNFNGNDTLDYNILHSPLVSVFPYREGFEETPSDWIADGINSSWTHGSPGKAIISRAAEGENVWTTGLNEEYNADEISYLYSPCFDLNGLVLPYLSFAIQYQLEQNYDFAWVEYRVGESNTWTKLGLQGNGTNWYNHISHSWSGDQLKWITTGIPVPVTNTTVQFRWVLQSDVGVEEEGIAIDQISVYDKVSIYTGAPTQIILPVSGNDWVHINSGGQHMFSIHPQGQDLGNVTFTLFKANQNFILADSFYLLSRNWVLTSSNPVNSSIDLRGYFTLTEANNLVTATGCPECIPSKDPFDFTAVRYSGTNEDGLFNNNTPTGVSAYSQDSVEFFAYENGYYAEWSSDDLSEWWISTPVIKTNGQLTRKISGASDDAEQHVQNGSVNTVRTTLSLTQHNGSQQVGLRFKNITVPQGSYIASAKIKLTSRDSSSQAAEWTLQSQINSSAEIFTTEKYDISLRPHSDQIVTWTPGAWVNNNQYESPEIKHLVQEVVDQSSWSNGNDLALIVSGTGNRDAWSYDGDPIKSAELFITFESECDDAQILYVDKDALGVQDGSSWTNAYRNLSQAIDRSNHCPAITQIWVAEGIYKPHPQVARTFSYALREGLQIYGGFQGIETSPEERIYNAYPTIISGDIGISGNPSDNLYHVVSILPGSSYVLLDGLFIEAGMANGTVPDLLTGAGIFNQGKLRSSHIVLQNNSYPAFYNAPGSELISEGLMEVRD